MRSRKISMRQNRKKNRSRSRSRSRRKQYLNGKKKRRSKRKNSKGRRKRISRKRRSLSGGNKYVVKMQKKAREIINKRKVPIQRISQGISQGRPSFQRVTRLTRNTNPRWRAEMIYREPPKYHEIDRYRRFRKKKEEEGEGGGGEVYY